MKKLLALLLVVCLGFAVFAGCNTAPGAPQPDTAPAEPAQPPVESAAAGSPAPAQETPAPIETHPVDFAALYASHAPEEIVATIDGNDVTWQEYFYWLYVQASEIDSYFAQMAAYYGQSLDWNDEIGDGSGATYAEVAAENAGLLLSQLYGIEKYAAEHDVGLTEADEQALAERLKSDVQAACGEGGTEEQLFEQLAKNYLPRALYERINALEFLYRNGLTAQYGEKGEKLSEDEALAFLRNEGYLCASHILFLSVDPSTGEAIEEEALAEKRQQAEALVEELRAIEDSDELVARFAALKEQYCEDTGKTAFPDGYIFREGTMVQEFEDTVKSLEVYGVSDPVESSYGLHIILRIPENVDLAAVVSTGNAARTIREVCSESRYGEQMQAYVAGITPVYAEGFRVDIADYVKE